MYLWLPVVSTTYFFFNNLHDAAAYLVKWFEYGNVGTYIGVSSKTEYTV